MLSGTNKMENNIDDDIERDAIIAGMSKAILATRDEAIEAKAASGIERKWKLADEAYNEDCNIDNKISSLDAATGERWVNTQDRDAKRSKITMNVIRSKTDTAISRFVELQFPSDDKNWGLKTTPVSDEQEINQASEGQGFFSSNQIEGQPQQAPVNQVDDAESRCEKMALEIDDQLNECDYNGECRKAARQAGILGTGVLKGPNVVKSVSKAWEPRSNGDSQVQVLKVIEKFNPASKYVDVWNVYPDPYCGDDPDNISYIWERSIKTARKLRDLIGVPGYNSAQIKKVLKEEPLRSRVTQDKGGSYKNNMYALGKGAPYEMWEYHGELSKELLPLFGCECDDDMPDRVSVCMEFVNDRPIKAVLNTLDTGDLPYDFFQWVKVDGSLWGLGEPLKILTPQRVINGAWRMMMDNGGDSAGVNIIVGDGVEPIDDKWEFAGRKFWRIAGDTPANQAFAQFQVSNNQADYERILDLAIKFIDIETGTPLVLQGQKDETPETLGGFRMRMDNSDSVRRLAVKTWDDNVTRRHLKRYYDWNMQYNPKEDIKGDMQVDPRGVSVLLVKDEKFMSLMQIMQLRADPDAAAIVDWEAVIKQLMQARHLNDVINSDEKIQQLREQQAQQQQQAMPQIEAAKIRVQGDMEKAKLVQQSDMTELQLKEKIEQESLQLKREMMQMEHQHQERLKQLDYQIKMMELSQAQQVSLESIKAALASDSMKLNVQKELAYNTDKARQVSTPETEPPGHAPDGQAYQR